MTRPRHVYLLDPDEDSDEDLQSSQPGPIASASVSSRAIRRIPSYRPLPIIPGASQNSSTTSTATAAAAAAAATASTTTSASTRPLPSLSAPTRLGLQPAPPSSPTRPTCLRESSSPPPSPTAAVAPSWQRHKPRSSIRIPPLKVEPSSLDNTDDVVDVSCPSSMRQGTSTVGTMVTEGTAMAQPSISIPTRVGQPRAGLRTPTSPTFAASLATVSAVHSSSSSVTSLSSNRSTATLSLTSTPVPVPTTSTSPPSSFPLSSLTSTPVPAPTHRLARKSRSKLNLKSQSSNSTLRPKRSKASLVPPALPSPEVLTKRGHNMNPCNVFVNRLPPELLGAVFLSLTSSPSSLSSSGSVNTGGARLSVGTTNTAVVVDTKAPRTISQVCHFWRCVALDEPLLWARTLNLREGPRWIIETLKRSGECTIDVIGLGSGVARFSGGIGGGDWNWNSRNRISDDCSGVGRGTVGRMSVLGVVLNELKRIRKLHLTIERKEEWRWFLDVLMREEAPVLESLAVKSLVRRVTSISAPGGGGYDGHGSRGGSFGSSSGGGGFDVDSLDLGAGDDSMKLGEGMFRGRAPKLKALSLSMVSLCTFSPLPYLSSLTTLQITDLEDTYQMAIWSWLSIVRQTPLLHVLILRSVFSPEMPAESPSQTSNVVLKRLRLIELKGTLMECCEFLEKLVVPGECKLAMGCNRANNANAATVLGDWMRERKRRSEHMEGILKTPWEVMKESGGRRRSLLVHPSVAGLVVKVNEAGTAEEDEGECVVNLDLAFGFVDPQSEERHRIVIEIFDILTRALQMVYEDKGGFGALNVSLFGVRDGIRFWGDELARFLAWLDRVEHLQEVSGYTASVVFPLLVHPPQQQQQHQRRGSAASATSAGSTERFRQSVLLPSLSRVTLAFVEFGENVDDEFEASCDVRAVPDFVRRRCGLAKAMRPRVKVQFECCSGPKRILDELRRLGVEFRLGWACDFDNCD